MKPVLAIVAIALLGLAPGVSACELDDTTAAATPPAQLGLAQAPAASKAPAQKTVKATVAKARAATRDKTAATDSRMAAAAITRSN